MNAGKAASQAGHAFLDSFLNAPPDIQFEYVATGHGTKVVLVAANELALQSIYYIAQDHELPCALVTDSGHVMPPHFDGSPIITAVGIGPTTREKADRIMCNLRLLE